MLPRSPAGRRYFWRIMIALGLYAVSLIAANKLIDMHAVGEPLVWLLAAMPGLAMAGGVFAIGMLIVEQTDEFIRMLVVRQTLIATGIALTLAAVWGFLEDFELVNHLNPMIIVVTWLIGFAIGGLVNRIQHGTWGDCW